MRKIKDKVNWTKRNLKLVLVLLFVLALLLLSCTGGDSTGLLAMALIGGIEGGKHVVDGPLTTDLTREGSPELLLNEIDRQITKIRPMATPIDQISRQAGSKHAGSMVVDYYSVDTKPTVATVVSVGAADAEGRVVLGTSDDTIFSASDTILVPGVLGYDEGGAMTSNELVLYVVDRPDSGGVRVLPVNGMPSAGNLFTTLPADFTSGYDLVRMGRAASELDVVSPQFESLPVKERNYCQIFKMQVEQSTLQKLARKEVGWTMSDQEEAAIYDMRMGMEKSFLFGSRRKVWDPAKKEWIMFTGGIWYQAGKDANYSGGSLTEGKLIDMMRAAFTGNAGSKRKILIGGSELIGAINKLQYTRVATSTQSMVKWGIDFTELRSKFGSLYVLMSEVFDEVGMPGNGMIVDPDYLTKYSHIPFGTEQLNLKASGVRNVDALVLTEASCIVLRYPKAHMRISMQ